MPASPSPSPSRRRSYAIGAALGAIALLGIVIVALPASLAGRVLPPAVRASDFSGSLWHGAAGRILVRGQDSGAVEWRLHPGELLGLKVGLDAIWVKGGFSLSATGMAGIRGIEASTISGGGALEDIAMLTGMAGWRGTASVAISHLTADRGGLESIAGDIAVAALHSANVGDDDELGGYTLHFDAPAADGTGMIVGHFSDTGAGPLQARGTVTLATHSHTATLTGTVRERPGASPALRQALEQLTQMRPRDGAGNIPLDVEFSW